MHFYCEMSIPRGLGLLTPLKTFMATFCLTFIKSNQWMTFQPIKPHKLHFTVYHNLFQCMAISVSENGIISRSQISDLSRGGKSKGHTFPAYGHIFSHFHFFLNFGKTICWCPVPRTWKLRAIFYGESWIRLELYMYSTFLLIDNIDNNGNIHIRGFTTWKKSSNKMLPAVGLDPRQPLILSPTLSSLH